MATVEHCGFLSPALKAKLQDNGILYVADVLRVLTPLSVPPHHDDAIDPAAQKARLELAFPFLSSAELASLAESFPNCAREHDDMPLRDLTLTSSGTASSAACQQSLRAVLAANTPSANNGATEAVPTPLSAKTSIISVAATLAPRPRATTFCRSLDELLGGGVLTRSVTELAGPPGVGKTQLLQQLAVSCVLPAEFGGLGGSCLYVDTEGSFSAERLRQMMVAAVALVQSASSRVATTDLSHTPALSHAPGVKRPRETDAEADESTEADAPNAMTGAVSSSPSETAQAARSLAALAERFTVDDALDRVFYVRCTELTDLIALLHTMDLYKSTRVPNLRMLVIDSIAFPFRTFQESTSSASSSAGFSHRFRSLVFTCSQLLQRLAADLDVTVIVSNHVTTRTLYLASTDLEGPAEGHSREETARSNRTSTSTTPSSISTTRGAGGEGSGSGPFRGSEPAQRTTVLIPALGENWSCGISTRILLSFHHYGVVGELNASSSAPSAAPLGSAHGLAEAPPPCREDVVVISSRTQLDATGVVRQYESVVQHRVARLLCSPTEERAECCFAITRKGVRDVPRTLI